MQNKLYLFIEGEWDRMFFETFLDAYLCKKYNFEKITCIEFAEKPESREMLRRFIKEGKVNFLLCPDLDSEYKKGKEGEDIRLEKIKKLAQQEFKLDSEEDIKTVQNKSFVVVQKIESWYLAGFNETFCNERKIAFYEDTEMTTKGTFIKIAKQLQKRPSMLRDMLRKTYRHKFSIEEAKERNQSFRKFFDKVESQTKRLS